MNPRHFTAILRMQWQLMRNRFRQSGRANWIITLILMVGAGFGSLSTFVFAAGWGGFFLAMIEPFYVIYVWDVLAGMFLFAWTIGLMVELQRSEMFSLKNLLHLPVSLSGAFFLNYASSLASLTVLMFLPPMLGLCLASVLRFGSRSLVVFALLPAFLFMVTAVSYQLRGWLARMMENKRTRGTVIVITTIAFIMVFQIPTLFNLGNATSLITGPQGDATAFVERMAELDRQHKAGEIDGKEYAEASNAAHREFDEQRGAYQQSQTASLNRTATVMNAALPIGWLPYGASAAAVGALVSPWLCVLGMSTIGAASLTLAYRSTLRSYTGDHNRARRSGAAKRATGRERASLLERRVPFLNEAQSVVTLATLRATLRAPEAKMALLTPLIFACIYGSMIFTGKLELLPEAARPWFGIGALAMSLFGMVQLMLNMFGLDRQGFRAYVLMPAPRRDILLGKNLGIFPIAGTLSGLLIVFMGIAVGMQLSHVVANLLQIVVAFFLYSTVSNFTSIIAPIGIAIGSMRPVSMKFSVVASQFVAMLLVPVAVIPAALALGVELLAHAFGGTQGIPMYLLLTLLQLPLALWFYHAMLSVQGRHLQDREQAILEVISKVVD